MKLACLALLLIGCDSTGGRLGPPGHNDLAGTIVSTDLAGSSTPSPTTIFAHEASALYVIDPLTFDATLVGMFGVTDSMTDLAVTPDGQIYTISKTSLYKVDAHNAAATMIMSGISSSNVALTFLTDGKLLAADQAGMVRQIDPIAKTVHDIGSYGSGFDTAGDLVAVADGTMFGISKSGPGSSSTSNVLMIVNTTNGHGTGVGPIGFTKVFGIAYAGGKVLAFTGTGDIISIDHTTGAGTLVKAHPGKAWFGAGTSPLVPIS